VSQVEERLLPGFWGSVWKLLHLRWLIFWRGFIRSRLRHKIGMIVLVLAVLAILGFIFFMTWQLLRFLNTPELVQFTGDLTGLIESIPNLIVGLAFFGVFLISFGVLLQALYLSGDMDFLLSTPVPIRAVFVAKLLQAVLPNFALICLFALPVLFGLGISAGYTLLYYPAVLLLLVMLALAAAGLAALMVMVIVRIFPARRVAEVLGFLGAISTFICSQTGQIARFSSLSSDQAGLALADRLCTGCAGAVNDGDGFHSLISSRRTAVLHRLGEHAKPGAQTQAATLRSHTTWDPKCHQPGEALLSGAGMGHDD